MISVRWSRLLIVQVNLNAQIVIVKQVNLESASQRVTFVPFELKLLLKIIKFFLQILVDSVQTLPLLLKHSRMNTILSICFLFQWLV